MNGSHDAVQSAFEALLHRSRSQKTRAPTVAAVAAHASISRSSMYRFHADVVERIRVLSAPGREGQHHVLRIKTQLLARRLKAQQTLTKALARACAELAAEKAALVEQLEEERLRFSLRVETLQKRLSGANALRLE